MKKLLHLALLLVFLASGAMAFASNQRIARFGQTLNFSNAGNWKSVHFKKPAHGTINQHGLTLGPTGGYSLIEGPDGTQWYATQTFTTEQYYYTESCISIYNSLGEKQGNITVAIPDSVSCNQVLLGEAISSNLFDKDKNTYEVPVILHYILSPGVTTYVSLIYDLATGVLKQSYDGFMSIYPYYTGYSTEWIGIRSYSSTADGATTANYDIYTKPTLSGTTAQLKKTFSIATTLAEYQIGSVLNVFTLDNNPYYVVSRYEKEYLDPASYQEPWDMIPTENNNFIATIYNKSFTEIGKITIPVTSTKDYLVQYGVGLYGSEDFTKNFWDNSGNINLVIASSGFQVTTEGEEIAFDVYSINGDKVKNIVTGVGDWMKMYSIAGQPEQMAFLSADEATLSMIDIPSCDTVATFGTSIDGYAISTNIDRYPVGDSYQYAIGIANPETDANGNIYQQYAWVNKDLTLDRIVKFNLGSNNASWMPIVIGEVLNPYLFDTDDEREYAFIANQYAEGTTSGNITDEIRIVNEDGTILRRFIEDPTGKGDLGTSTILGINDGTPTLLIPYYNSSTDACSIDLEFLPLEKFSKGGDGSAENPYLISSIGDMAMIGNDPSANYKIVNSFSAANYGVWSGIPSFTGSLDGDNFTISDLKLNGNNVSSAIFASAENAIIKNFTLESPSMEIGNAGTAGFVVAEALSDTITNITIVDASIRANDDAYSTIGGLVGSAMLNCVISGCHVSNIVIDAASCSSVGGIAGDTRTGSTINACAVNGRIRANSSIGGIVGVSGTDCAVTNCHANTQITGLNTIGGIVGKADRGGIHLCYAEGSISASEADFNGYYSAGGIAGYLTPSFSAPTTEGEWKGMVISNNVVALVTIDSPAGAVHRIIGYSRWDDDITASKWDSSIIPTVENAIDNNYAVSGLSAIDKSLETVATSTEGADIEASSLNQNFFASIGFKYGTSDESPWNIESTNNPCLYFEEVKTDGIEDVADDNDIEISFDGSNIVVPNAVKLEIYNLNGIKIATGIESVNTTNIASGIYVIAAYDLTGTVTTGKIAIK